MTRIAFIACHNLDGSEKMLLMIIADAERLCTFKRNFSRDLSFVYHFNKNGLDEYGTISLVLAMFELQHWQKVGEIDFALTNIYSVQIKKKPCSSFLTCKSSYFL